MTTFHFRPQIIHQLTWFKDSPDTGDPACKCSYCGKLIEEGQIPLRVWRESDDTELRLHMDCARVVVVEFAKKIDRPLNQVSDVRPKP